jgi:hypothetical protein
LTQITAMQHREHFKQMTDVARAVALPSDYPAVRYPSFPALERTATLAFTQQSTYTLAADNQRGMLARSAVAPLWLQQPGNFAYGYACRLPFRASDGNTQRALYPNGDSIAVDSFTNAWVNNKVDAGSNVGKVPMIVTNASPMRYDFPVVGRDDALPGNLFIYVPTGYRIGFALGTIGKLAGNGLYSSSPTNGTMNWNIERWVAPGEVQSLTLTALYGSVTHVSPPTGATTVPCATYADSGNAIFNGMSTDGWYRLSSFSLINITTADSTALVLSEETNIQVFVIPAATNTTVVAPVTTDAALTINVGAAGATASRNAMLPYFKPPEWSVSSLPWASTRLTAVGVLFTNVTKVLNKEGTVQAARLNPTSDNIYGQSSVVIPDSSQLANKHPSEKALLSLEKGFYTFCPPSTDLSKFWDYTRNSGTYEMGSSGADAAMRQLECPVYRLDNDALINYFIFSDPNANTAGDSTSLAVNLDFHIEFRSVSSLWPIGLSTMSLESFHQAQMALVQTGFFFNNDDPATGHNRIKTILSSLARYIGGPLAGAVVPYVYDAGLSILGRATTDLQARRDNRVLQPKTTTVTAVAPQSSQSSDAPRRRRRRRGKQQQAPAPKPAPQQPPKANKMASGLDQYLASRGMPQRGRSRSRAR